MDRVGNVFANLKLNQKFTLAIMLIVVMPMVGFSIFLYQNISKNTLQQSASELGNQVKEDYGTMQSIVEFSNMSAQSFLGNQALKDMLLRLKDHEEIRTEDYIAFNRDDIAGTPGEQQPLSVSGACLCGQQYISGDDTHPLSRGQSL